jgi:hypothetical protein
MEDKLHIKKEDIKIRNTWPNRNDFDPSTKVEVPKSQKKNRSSEKQALKKILQDIDNLDDLDIYE